MKRLITKLLIAVALLAPVTVVTGGMSGCAIRGSSYVVHPGAVNELDSRVYDSLLFAKGVLSEADSNPSTSDYLRPVLDVLRRSHAVAYADWMLYRTAVQEGRATEAERISMQESRKALNSALSAFESTKNGTAVDPLEVR